MLYPELMLNFHIPQLRLYMQSKNEPGVAEESTTSHALINDILQKVLKLCTACVWKIACSSRMSRSVVLANHLVGYRNIQRACR